MPYPRLSLYRYLDVDGIESLHAQLTDRVEIEMRSSKSGEAKAGGKAKLGLGELFRALLGMSGEAELTADLLSSRKREVLEKLATEQKLRAVIQYLERADTNQLSTDLEAAARRCLLHDQSLFVLCEGHFNAPQFWGGQDGKSAAEAAGAIFFERGPAPGRAPSLFEDPYDYSDTYYKHESKPTRVIMAAGIAKFTRSVGGRLDSHDTIYLSASSGVRVRLSVFGQMTPVGDMFVQIKPLALY